MTKSRLARLSLCALPLLAACLALPLASWLAAADSKEAAPDPAAVKRAQKQVQMLDHIYKTAVVLITDKYVHDEDDFPAGSAAVALFKSVTDKGYHGVRLIDVTGQPYEEKNVAQDAFEKAAVKKLQNGQAYVEAIEQAEGQPVLRAMTPVPVVMEKCTMCHAHYKDAPQGAAIGAISYTVPIE